MPPTTTIALQQVQVKIVEKLKQTKTKSHTRGHKANASQDSQVPEIDRQGREECVCVQERESV